jgi:predicted Zn-dependent protease
VQPTGSVELNVKTADLASSAWAGASTADFTDVDTAALAEVAARRLAWGARRVTLPAGRYDTLLPPSAVADLMIYLAWSMDGRSAQEGRSALAGRVGERLTALPLTLACDPAAPGLEYEPFLTTTRSDEGISVFDNGAPTRRVDWVREGVITELAYSRAEAAEFGASFAPSGDNLLLTGGADGALDDLVAATERGLLLTCLWYIRLVDPTTLLLTGLTRDGVYLVEHGEVVAEVDHNFRFNYSPLDVLRTASQVGTTERTLPREWKDWFTRAAMPPVRVPEFFMSSVSLGR